MVKMVMLHFGDIEPFLRQNNDHIGPTTRPKLLSFFADQQKLALLQLVDWGEPFVKATYFLKGDGPLALECYEAIHKVSETLHTANVQAVAQLSGAPPTDLRCQQLVAYAKSCAQPGPDYFQRQLGNSLATSLAAFKGARLFSPHKVYLLHPDTAMVEQSSYFLQ